MCLIIIRVIGFEPITFCAQDRCATELRYTLMPDFFIYTYFICIYISISSSKEESPSG